MSAKLSKMILGNSVHCNMEYFSIINLVCWFRSPLIPIHKKGAGWGFLGTNRAKGDESRDSPAMHIFMRHATYTYTHTRISTFTDRWAGNWVISNYNSTWTNRPIVSWWAMDEIILTYGTLKSIHIHKMDERLPWPSPEWSVWKV